MQLPIDVSAVIKEAANLDKEKTKQLSVGLYFDPTAPDDALLWVHDAFKTQAENVTIYEAVLDNDVFIPHAGDTIACIVAGAMPHIGHYAEALRGSGTPVMVVSFDPQACIAQAEHDGHPLLEADVVSPSSKLKKVSQAETPKSTREALELRMGQWVVAVAKANRLAFALAFPFVRKPLAHDAIQSTAMQNALVGVVFLIPGADLPIMTLNQAKMVLIIAAAYGQSLGLSQIKELAAVIAGGFACRTAARELTGLVPALGWAVKGSVGYGGTVAMGYAALKYYEHEAAQAEKQAAEGEDADQENGEYSEGFEGFEGLEGASGERMTSESGNHDEGSYTSSRSYGGVLGREDGEVADFSSEKTARYDSTRNASAETSAASSTYSATSSSTHSSTSSSSRNAAGRGTATTASQATTPLAGVAQKAAKAVAGSAKKVGGAAANAAANAATSAYVTITQSAATDGTVLNKAVSKAANVAAEAVRIPGVATLKDNAEEKVRDGVATIAQAADVVSSAAAGVGKTASKVAAAADKVKRHLS